MAKAQVVIHEKTRELGVKLVGDERYGRRYTVVIRERPTLLVDDDGFRVIEKPQNIPAELEQAIKKMIDSWHEMNGWEGYLSSMLGGEVQTMDPFKITLDDFNRLCLAEKVSVCKRATVLCLPYLQKYFEENSDADWVVVANSADNVVVHGPKDEKLDDDDITRIAFEKKVPVYIIEKHEVFQAAR